MRILYNIGIHIYILSIYIYSIFDTKANLLVKGQKHIFYNLLNKIKKENNLVWFHCSSLGEFEQAQPVIKTYKIKYPKDKILLTFFSSSGLEEKKNYNLADWVSYLPFDTEYNAEKFIQITNPKKVFLIKNEFWFNYMKTIKQRNIALYSIASTFREEQIFFKYNWCSKQLKNISHFFVQDIKSKNLLEKIGINSVTVIHDPRFDTVIENSKSKKNYLLIQEFCSRRDTIIFGSIHKEDEKILLEYINTHPEYNYIIVPHEIKYSDNIKEKTKGVLFTSIKNKNIHNNILIINKTGMLKSIYQYVNIAYIGGGFKKGVHNILEAIVYGVPVIFGPNYHKSLEAQELININLAKSILNIEEMNRAVISLKNTKTGIANKYINNRSGGSKEIINCEFI